MAPGWNTSLKGSLQDQNLSKTSEGGETVWRIMTDGYIVRQLKSRKFKDQADPELLKLIKAGREERRK